MCEQQPEFFNAEEQNFCHIRNSQKELNINGIMKNSLTEQKFTHVWQNPSAGVNAGSLVKCRFSAKNGHEQWTLSAQAATCGAGVTTKNATNK